MFLGRCSVFRLARLCNLEKTITTRRVDTNATYLEMTLGLAHEHTSARSATMITAPAGAVGPGALGWAFIILSVTSIMRSFIENISFTIQDYIFLSKNDQFYFVPKFQKLPNFIFLLFQFCLPFSGAHI